MHGRWFKAKDQPRIWVEGAHNLAGGELGRRLLFQIRKDIRDAMEALNAFFEEIRETIEARYVSNRSCRSP